MALAAAWIVDGRARVAVAVIALALVGGAQMERALDGQVHSSLARDQSRSR